jgi:hypothetical protein
VLPYLTELIPVAVNPGNNCLPLPKVIGDTVICSRKNAGIRRALEALGAGRVELCGPMEDSMFVHSFVVSATEREWLRARRVQNIHDLRVRINIGSTGVANFFFGVAGGVQLESAPEERLQPMCAEFMQSVMRVV